MERKKISFTRPKLTRVARLLVPLLMIFLLLLLWNNCSPFQNNPYASKSSQNNDANLVSEPQDKFSLLSCQPNSSVAPSDTRRLTKIEFINTIGDLFGSAILTEVSPTLSRLPEDLISNDVNQFNSALTEQHLDVIADLALVVGQASSSSNTRINQLLSALSTCQIDNVTTSCVSQFIKNIGLKIWRRPLTATEQSWLRTVYDTGSDARDRFGVLISTLLVSPEFSSHWELGSEGIGTNDSFEVTPYEIASRLSFGLWSTTPDATLLDLAQKGQLSDAQTLNQTVTSMLNNSKSKEKISQFFTFWLKTNNLPGISTNPEFLNGINTTGLREEMKRELDEFINYILFTRQGNYHELMTSSISFARTPELAQIYGHALANNPSLGTQQMGSGRKGLLLRGPFLISTTDYSHPITRGVLLRKRILCDTIGAPSPQAFAAQQQIIDSNQALQFSTRQRIVAVTSPSQCISCHSSINPLGFALENFDSLGRWRSTEINYNADFEVISQHPLDLHVENLSIDYQTGENVDSAAQLMDLIANSSKGSVCLSRQIFRYYNIREELEAGDACEVIDTNESLSSQNGSILEGIKKQILNRYLKTKVVKR